MIVRASIEGKQLSYGCWLLAVAVDGTSSIVNFLFISFFLYLYIYILEENSAFIYIQQHPWNVTPATPAGSRGYPWVSMGIHGYPGYPYLKTLWHSRTPGLHPPPRLSMAFQVYSTRLVQGLQGVAQLVDV